MNKKLLVGIVLTLALAAGIAVAGTTGFKLFTAVNHLNVQEGAEAQYYDGALWQPIAMAGGTFDLAAVNIMPGETKTSYIRIRNTATSGMIDLELDIETAVGITNDFLCVAGESDGMQYKEAANDYHFRAVAGEPWKQVRIDTTADGDIPAVGIEYDSTMTRKTVLGSYDFTC